MSQNNRPGLITAFGGGVGFPSVGASTEGFVVSLPLVAFQIVRYPLNGELFRSMDNAFLEAVSDANEVLKIMKTVNESSIYKRFQGHWTQENTEALIRLYKDLRLASAVQLLALRGWVGSTLGTPNEIATMARDLIADNSLSNSLVIYPLDFGESIGESRGRVALPLRQRGENEVFNFPGSTLAEYLKSLDSLVLRADQVLSPLRIRDRSERTLGSYVLDSILELATGGTGGVVQGGVISTGRHGQVMDRRHTVAPVNSLSRPAFSALRVMRLCLNQALTVRQEMSKGANADPEAFIGDVRRGYPEEASVGLNAISEFDKNAWLARQAAQRQRRRDVPSVSR